MRDPVLRVVLVAVDVVLISAAAIAGIVLIAAVAAAVVPKCAGLSGPFVYSSRVSKISKSRSPEIFCESSVAVHPW